MAAAPVRWSYERRRLTGGSIARHGAQRRGGERVADRRPGGAGLRLRSRRTRPVSPLGDGWRQSRGGGLTSASTFWRATVVGPRFADPCSMALWLDALCRAGRGRGVVELPASRYAGVAAAHVAYTATPAAVCRRPQAVVAGQRRRPHALVAVIGAEPASVRAAGADGLEPPAPAQTEAIAVVVGGELGDLLEQAAEARHVLVACNGRRSPRTTTPCGFQQGMARSRAASAYSSGVAPKSAWKRRR